MNRAQVDQLIDDAVDRAVDEPCWFMRDVLHVNLDLAEWQTEATEAIADVRRYQNGKPTRYNHSGKQRISIRAGHGVGKTHWLAAVAQWWMFTTYGLIAITAPKQELLRTRFFYRFKRILAGAEPWWNGLVKVDMLKASVGGDETHGIQGETAVEPENLAGYHDLPQLFLVDEASGRRMDAMFPVIEGALSTAGSVCVEIGNPTRDEGEFYQHHNRADISDLYYRMHVPPTRARGLVAQSWIDNMRRKYGEDSPVFKVRVLGDFAPMDRNQLISMTWIEQCRELQAESDGSLPKLRISVDVADGGVDFTVITAAHHYETRVVMLAQRKFNFPPSESPIRAADEAAAMFEEFNGNTDDGDDIVVDAIGVGAGTAGVLMDQGYNVVQFRSGEAVESGRFRNRRSQCYIGLRDAHRDEAIMYAEGFCDDWDEYVNQLCSIRMRSSEKFEDIETKETYLKRAKKSPDMADSAMMQFTDKMPELGKGSSLDGFGAVTRSNFDGNF